MSSNQASSAGVEPFQFDFFIAHAGADVQPAERLYNLLIEQARVFVDSRCLLYGDDWDIEIAEAQRRSYITIVLVSSRVEPAYYLREEIAASIAMARRDKLRHRVIPVYLDAISQRNSNIPYGLRLKHGLYVPASGELDGIADSLLALLRKLQETPSQHDTSGQIALLNRSANGEISESMASGTLPTGTKPMFVKTRYFCYISRGKVDDLYEQFVTHASSPQPIVQASPTEDTVPPLNDLYGNEIPYGRPDLIHKEASSKKLYARKLQSVLKCLDESVRPFVWAASSETAFLRFTGRFRVFNVDESQLIATLVSKALRKELYLDCSLSNFSHLTVENGRTSFQSTNYSFFSRRLAVTFETVFLLLTVNGSKFYGSPLFLVLENSPLISL